jgi:hypothetical protein
MIGAPGAPPMGMTGAPVPPIGGGLPPSTGPAFVRESTTGVPAGATSTPSGAPVVAPAGPGKLDTLLKDKGFGEGIAKMAGAAGGGKSKGQLDMSMPGPSNYDPSAASRQGAAKLFAEIMARHQQKPIGQARPPGMLG